MARKTKDKVSPTPAPAEEQTPQVEEQESTIDDIQKLSAPTKEDEAELKKLLKDAEKTFGEGVIASAEEILDVEKVKTRNLLLDILTNGGMPKGSITLFFGDESSGKTFQTLLLASVFTSQKIPVLYIGCEGDFDKRWAIKLGNDPKYFYISRPGDLETAINVADVAVRSRKFGLVIFDSVTAGVPKEALDKDAFSQQMALQARLNAKLCQKITSGLQPSNLKDPNAYNPTAVILISHVREKVGIVYGNPETIPGGHAIRHHSSYIVKFKKGAILTKDNKPVGREMKIHIDKAKFSRPLVGGIIELYFDPPRLNNAKVMVTYATQMGIIEQSGSFYSYKDVKAQGQKALLLALKEKPGILDEIKVKLIGEFNK
jgi:recombination protein RecA